MLVLKRLRDEEIIIGGIVTIKVVATGNGWAKIGIDAPQNISVHRREIYDVIRATSIDEIRNGKFGP